MAHLWSGLMVMYFIRRYQELLGGNLALRRGRKLAEQRAPPGQVLRPESYTRVQPAPPGQVLRHESYTHAPSSFPLHGPKRIMCSLMLEQGRCCSTAERIDQLDHGGDDRLV